MEIRKVVPDDAALLFEWANDPETRSKSFHSQLINWESHLSWIERKLNDAGSSFYLLHQAGEPIGVVRIETTNECIIGVTVAPNHRGKGLASTMIKLACSTFRKKNNDAILAYIKKENLASVKAFERAGFVLLKSGRYNDEECLILIFY